MATHHDTASSWAQRRLRSMRHVQGVAVALFAEHGFDAVSVERVARAADVAPASIYRWFATKEGLVLWDDYDPGLLAAIGDALAERAPLDAVRAAVVDELDVVYDADRELVLARTQLVHREPALLAAAHESLRELQGALRHAFAAAGAGRDDLVRAVLAAAAVGALAAAVEAWQADQGRTPLARFVDAAFAALEAR